MGQLLVQNRVAKNYFYCNRILMFTCPAIIADISDMTYNMTTHDDVVYVIRVLFN